MWCVCARAHTHTGGGGVSHTIQPRHQISDLLRVCVLEIFELELEMQIVLSQHLNSAPVVQQLPTMPLKQHHKPKEHRLSSKQLYT